MKKKLGTLAQDQPPVTTMQVLFRTQLTPAGEVARLQIHKDSTSGVEVDILLTREQALSLADTIRARFG